MPTHCTSNTSQCAWPPAHLLLCFRVAMLHKHSHTAGKSVWDALPYQWCSIARSSNGFIPNTRSKLDSAMSSSDGPNVHSLVFPKRQLPRTSTTSGPRTRIARMAGQRRSPPARAHHGMDEAPHSPRRSLENCST